MRRARHAYAEALEAMKLGNLEDAADAANEMCYLLALTKIIDPLVEVDNAGKLVAIQIKVIPLIFGNFHSYLTNFSRFASREIQRRPKLWQGTGSRAC